MRELYAYKMPYTSFVFLGICSSIEFSAFTLFLFNHFRMELTLSGEDV